MRTYILTLFLYFGKNTPSFAIKFYIRCIFYMVLFLCLKKFSFTPNFLSLFLIWNGCWILCFFHILRDYHIIFLFQSVNMVNCIGYYIDCNLKDVSICTSIVFNCSFILSAIMSGSAAPYVLSCSTVLFSTTVTEKAPQPDSLYSKNRKHTI